MHHPLDSIVHTTAFFASVVEYLLERNKSSVDPPLGNELTTSCTMRMKLYIAHYTVVKYH